MAALASVSELVAVIGKRARRVPADRALISTLNPGDLIGTGTPGGVGEARKPPVYLKAGDTSVCSIEKIGSLTNPVQAKTGD